MPSIQQGYTGIAPGATAMSPLPKPNLKTWGSKLVWTGYQNTADGSRVFFQVAGPLEYELKPGKTSLLVTLRSCRIHLKNNARTLVTRFFPTPVRTVSVKQLRKDLAVSIALKEPAPATPRIDVGPEGTQFLVLDFPPGKADAPPQAAPAEPLADSSRQDEEPLVVTDRPDDEGVKGKKSKKALKRSSGGTLSVVSGPAPASSAPASFPSQASAPSSAPSTPPSPSPSPSPPPTAPPPASATLPPPL